MLCHALLVGLGSCQGDGMVWQERFGVPRVLHDPGHGDALGSVHCEDLVQQVAALSRQLHEAGGTWLGRTLEGRLYPGNWQENRGSSLKWNLVQQIPTLPFRHFDNRSR